MDVQTRSPYRIQTFGGLSVAGGTAPLTGAATQRKTLLLLAVIAAAGAPGVSRERLLTLFWPESDAERARNTLKQALHILRRDLRDPDLIVGTATLRLNPDSIASDVAEFEEALRRGELERAVGAYHGPFLDGLYLDGSPEFERWLERERARLAHAHAGALEKLAVAATAAGDPTRAVAWWRRLAAADPMSSRVAVELMKALAAVGEPEAALQHARVHETLVQQELEIPCDPAVTALATRLREELRDAPRAGLRTASAPLAAPLVSPSASPPVRDAQPAVAVVPPSAPAASPAPVTRRSSAARPRLTGAFVITRRRMALAVTGLLVLVVAGGAVVARPARETPPRAVAPPVARSIAVLPFIDMSADGTGSYLGDGLSEELITALARIDGLQVAARTSSFALRDARLDVRRIGDTLGVATVMEGSVRRDGDRLRVTAQLIDARSGYHLWSQAYDRRAADVIAVQDEIAGAIAGALQLTLAERPTSTTRTRNPEAYDLYLRGTWLRNKLSRDAVTTAIAYFDRAIALDSGYAPAYAGKATAIGPLLYFDPLPREPRVSAMRAAAQRALALDDRLGEAHVAMGITHMFYEWDWPAAERELRRATTLNPRDAHAWHHTANWMRAMGRLDEAIAARQRALALDPLNARTALTLGHDYTAAGKYDLAMEAYRRARDIDPDNPLFLGVGPHLPSGPGEMFERQGRPDSAFAEYARVATRRGATAGELAAMRRAYAEEGLRGFWKQWLHFEERQANGRPRAIRIAAVHVRIGDTAEAMTWLERAYAERDPGLIYLHGGAEWQPLRREPRMIALLERMHLPH